LTSPWPRAARWPQVASGTDDPGAFVEDFCRWREIPLIEQLARYSRVPEVAAALVAGSHRGPWLMPRTFLTRQAHWFPEGSLAELPDIDADPAAFDIRRYALQPGDAIFFDFLTVHGAPGFPYQSRRRVLSSGRHDLSRGLGFAAPAGCAGLTCPSRAPWASAGRGR
jgi:hypothetical protein